jgi:primosomal protein N' (replication factor Y)
LPRLAIVGIVSAETSLTLPDFTSEERTFQLLYQVIGRVGRHGAGKVIIQSYEPNSPLIKAAATRNFESFYKTSIKERQAFRFPPFSYLMKLVCRRTTVTGAQKAADDLRLKFIKMGLPVEVIGPSATFYPRRGKYYFNQLIVKSKDRKHLLELGRQVPAGWTIDLDPIDLL